VSIYPGAIWEPVAVAAGRGSNGRMHAYTGIVLHCNDAESLDLNNFETDSLSGKDPVTSHFQVLDDGTVYQYVDTAYSAWCQGAGNDTYLSIESEGRADEPATPQQIAAIHGILQWANLTHGIPLQLADAPGHPGFGWHGMGAPSWGHAECPGVRKDQRPAMLAGVQPPKEEEDVYGLPHIILNQANVAQGFLVYPSGRCLAITDGETGANYKANGSPVVIVGASDFARIAAYLGATA
jgi:hypothetical protein